MGVGYGRTIVESHVLTALGGLTALDALQAGVAPGVVWRTICEEFDLPDSVHWGLPDPPSPARR